MAAVTPVADLAHELENLYEVAGGPDRPAPAPSLFDVLHRGHDRLADMIDALRQGRARHRRRTWSRPCPGPPGTRPRRRPRNRRRRSRKRTPRRNRPRSATRSWWRSSWKKPTTSWNPPARAWKPGSRNRAIPWNCRPCSVTCTPSRAAPAWPRSPSWGTWAMSWKPSTKPWAWSGWRRGRRCSICCTAATTGWRRWWRRSPPSGR
ncbi:hypothetical protein ASALC70_02322 [Alcanivorax sp. ALC70]|nr:hypothetical protein ASALC70_02322 [Alcanivorax sp. ALC70]